MYRYDDLSILAEGGQGRVYRAIDRVSGNRCVLKTGHSVLSEAFLALQLNHPYIANPFDAGIYDNIGQAVVYPEYGDPSLLEWRKTAHIGELQRVALQIAEFLAFVHHRGWLYHDFKSEHFLVSNQAIRVLDLGLAEPIDKTSQTFSGTFPYIAPERLAGRKCDARSDIFAMGMLLLHALLPDERWDFEPSLEVLQDLQQRTRKLPDFWRTLLTEMISLEPAQRIESAAELWKRLLPSSARTSFLFFPTPTYFHIPLNLLKSKRIAFFHTSSNLNISEIERYTLHESWKEGSYTVTFDLRYSSPEEVIQTLCEIQINQQSSDVFSSLELLRKQQGVQPLTIVLRYPDTLNPSHRSLLTYSLSALQNISTLRFVLLGCKQVTELPDEWVLKVEVPLLTRKTSDEVLHHVFPPDDVRLKRLETIRSKSFVIPDQIFADLRQQLPKDPLVWPAPARDLAIPASIEHLKPTEIRIIAALAIAASPLSKQWLLNSLRLSETQGLKWLDNLQAGGYLQIHNHTVSLVINSAPILKSLRKDKLQKIASSMLSRAAHSDPQVLYKFAKMARDRRIAAIQAIRAASQHRLDSNAALRWFWKAFSAGEKLSESQLFKLVKFTILRGKYKSCRKILYSIRNCFGASYRLAFMWIQFYMRTSDFRPLEEFATKIVERAKKKKQLEMMGFFYVWKVASLVFQNKYTEAHEVLTKLRKLPFFKKNQKLMALSDHYLGLESFFQGNFEDAIHFTQRAVMTSHVYRSTSMMNLGIFYLRLGNFLEGEKWLSKALRIFKRNNDSQKLAYLFNNLGILFKRKGQIQESRDCYSKCLPLSRLHRNHLLAICCLTNLSETYEIEGKIGRALAILIAATREAKRINLNDQVAFCLNYRGRLYGILGDYKKSVRCLKQAIKIREELKTFAELALSHECLGLTYYLSGHSNNSIQHFSQALDLFKSVSSSIDCKRNSVFIALLRNDFHSLVTIAPDLQQNSFELALYHYSVATLSLKSKVFKDPEIRNHLHEAERIFRNVPSLFWLGKVLKLKTEFFLTREHFEKAKISLQSAHNIFSRLGAKKELLMLNRLEIYMENPSDMLKSIAERLPYKVLLMVKDVLTERNPEKMINRILSTSLEFTDMERAVLILAEDPPRIFKSTTFDDNSVQEIFEISRSAMEEAAESRQPYIRLNAIEDPYLKGKPSIIANRIGSVLCLPLRSAEKAIGVLYLDSREGISSVAKTESVLLDIFSNIMSLVLEDAVALEKSRNENEILKQKIQNNHLGEILGSGKVIEDLKKTVYRLSRIDHHILITGETGVGKELVARMLHESSKRKNASFIAINCASLPEMLLENELFGHEKGAFTDATHVKKGLFEEAENGTLFLDEIGELPYSVQAKLLRVLQEREFRRIGGNTLLHSNARIILATNKDLLQLVQKNQFREDLFYRVSGVQIHIPPLRERKEDIALLAKQFLKTADVSNKFRGFSRDALHLMEQYSWPGNIRQLKYEVERIAALCENTWIQPEDFSKLIHVSSKEALKTETLKSIEKEVIQERLKRFDWNIVRTANSLGLTRHGLYSKMKLFGIKKKSTQKSFNKKV